VSLCRSVMRNIYEGGGQVRTKLSKIHHKSMNFLYNGKNSVKNKYEVENMSKLEEQGVTKELAKAFASLKNQKSGIKIVSKKIKKASK